MLSDKFSTSPCRVWVSFIGYAIKKTSLMLMRLMQLLLRGENISQDLPLPGVPNRPAGSRDLSCARSRRVPSFNRGPS